MSHLVQLTRSTFPLESNFIASNSHLAELLSRTIIMVDGRCQLRHVPRVVENDYSIGNEPTVVEPFLFAIQPSCDMDYQRKQLLLLKVVNVAASFVYAVLSIGQMCVACMVDCIRHIITKLIHQYPFAAVITA